MPGLSMSLANRGDLQVFHGAAEGRDPRTGWLGGTPLTSGEGVLLHAASRGPRHLWIDSQGRVLGSFEADPHPTRLLRTRGGPHVLERDRLRVGTLA